jgi:hypothetical protein
MAEGMRSISYLVFQFLEFARRHLLVRGAESLTSNQSLLRCDLPSGDCICDKQKQHSPNYERHHDFAELRDQSRSQGLCNKHIDHHRAQTVHVLKVELHGDKEFEQI